MTPMEEAERELRAALDSGDIERIVQAERKVDQLDVHPEPVPMLAAALWYAEHGLRVFPLSPGSKIPFKGTRGCLDATDDPGQLREWWEATPDANVGVATGHLVDVVDIDGYTGQVSRSDHWQAFERLAVLGIVSTPRDGGVHLYVPASGRGNKTGLYDNVDYRGIGGYVVGPPSRTDVGAYAWLTPLDVNELAE